MSVRSLLIGVGIKFVLIFPISLCVYSIGLAVLFCVNPIFKTDSCLGTIFMMPFIVAMSPIRDDDGVLLLHYQQ